MNTKEAFNGIYNGKTVLVTGHTGFKGSWLTVWLLSLRANVIGYSAYLPSEPNNFEACMLYRFIEHLEKDVRDFSELTHIIQNYRPEIVFHLAAQPIVRKSYDDSKYTFDTNVGGIVNLLESLKKTESIKAAVIITSDKCYRNAEWFWGYRENDELGGDNPYSASKACAELVCRSYSSSFFHTEESPRISTVRAGNVIGGGDWAEDRIIPDCVKAWSKGEEVIIRNPEATRPWQHVLEPLSGYLLTGANLLKSSRISGEAFNFGPDATVNKSVQELLETFRSYWGNAKWKHEKEGTFKMENTLLRLSCDKALQMLNWQPVLTFDDTVRLTSEWYKEYYQGCKDMYDFSNSQINYYVEKAEKKGLLWASKKDFL